MSVVNLKIRGTEYNLSCDTGEEDKLIKTAQSYDDKLAAIESKMMAFNERLMFVMTGILMQDRINDLEEMIANTTGSDIDPMILKKNEEALCESVDLISSYIENLCAKYEKM